MIIIHKYDTTQQWLDRSITLFKIYASRKITTRFDLRQFIVVGSHPQSRRADQRSQWKHFQPIERIAVGILVAHDQCLQRSRNRTTGDRRRRQLCRESRAGLVSSAGAGQHPDWLAGFAVIGWRLFRFSRSQRGADLAEQPVL